MQVFILLVLALTILLGVLIIFKTCVKRKKLNLPNGPTGVPVLGNFLQIVLAPHLKFSKWAKQYGSLYTVYFASRPALVINDPLLLKELFGLYAATGKFKMENMLLLSRGLYGILNTEGPLHSEQRTFCLKALRQFGFGTRSTESKILPQIHDTIDWLEDQLALNNNSIEFMEVVKKIVANTTYTIVSGEKLKDPQGMVDLLDNLMATFMYSCKTGLSFLPWIGQIAPNISGWTALNKYGQDFHDFFADALENQKQSWKPGSPPRHTFDCYFEELVKRADSADSSFEKENGFANAVASTSEILLAAVETTSAALTWLVYYLIWNPEMQQKLQQELDQVIGENVPGLEHRDSLPYTDAVILETFRHSSFIPMGLPHEVIEDIPDFHGYNLPKGLILIPNLYGIHHNESTWGDPQNFRPDRFLEGSESRKQLREHLIPFSTGRRICMGETLAKDIIFLAVVHIFQRFSMKPVFGISKETYFKQNIGTGLMPYKYPVQIIKRF